jgi:hypothetical protein
MAFCVAAVTTARSLERMTARQCAAMRPAFSARKRRASVLSSCDYVFDGGKDGCYAEEEVPNPQRIYGKTKFAGEQALPASGAKSWSCVPAGCRCAWRQFRQDQAALGSRTTWAEGVRCPHFRRADCRRGGAKS